MSNQKNIVLVLFFIVFLPVTSLADSFLVPSQTTVDVTQLMDGNDEVGIVELGGNINTPTDNNFGIRSTGARVSIINKGEINTTGSNSVGIWSTGAGASIINRGEIYTAGFGSYGIISAEIGATIINSGNINTAGFGSLGLVSDGLDAIIINTGNIETTDQYNYGIDSTGANARITNDGLINTAGADAPAIKLTGLNTHVTNNGIIKTNGERSYGVVNYSINGKVINTGAISTLSDASVAINSTEMGSSVINIGHITTFGMQSDGIIMRGANSTVTNYGQITTSGIASFAIEVKGSNSIVTNYGNIYASPEAFYAILGDNGKQTLNIMPGSRITGRINLEGVGDNDEVNFFGSDGSASITIESGENIRILNSNAIQIGSRIVYVDPTISALSMLNLNSMTNVAHSSVAQRFSVGSPSESAVWANTFVQRDQSDNEEHIQANKSHLAGAVIGHERMDAVNPFGFLGGVARSDTTSLSNRRESDSFFFGAYGRHDADSVQFSGSLLFGRREHQLQRQVLDNLNGSMTAYGRTRGLFVSPSIRISGTNSTLSLFGIQPSATITYSLERLKGYSETGAEQNNIQFGRQKIEALSTRLQLEKTQTMSRGEFRMRAGVHSRNTRSRDVVSHINGTAFTINSQPDDRAVGLFAGVHADIRLTGPLRLKLTAEYGELGGSEKFTNGSLVIFTPF